MKILQTICISLFIIIYTSSFVNAQYCTPTYSNQCASGDVIDDFTFSNISNLNSGCNGDSNNYSYSNMLGTVTSGNTYTIMLQSGTYSQGFGVWIDYNQDGDFADVQEFVFASLASSTALQTGSIKIPDSALAGTTRLRVRSRYNNTITDTQYCSNFTYGETEDYKLFITLPTSPPIADFSANVTQSCSGVIIFSDLSSNNPNKWNWDFGDGKNDTVKNPTHIYTSQGVFNVQLIVSNSYGADTIIKNAYIKVESSDTLPYNQNFETGATSINDFKVTVNSQSDVQVIAAASNASSFGLMMGGKSSTSWTNPTAGEEFTDNPLHNASASLCIDATGVTSLVLVFDLKLQYEYQNYYTNFRVTANGTQVGSTYQPNGATTSWSNQIIDLSAFAGSVIEVVLETSCKYSYNDGGVSTGNGAFIDNIQIMAMTSPPISGFTQNKKLTCDGQIQFTDQSGFGPTGWKWDFGDGKIDTLKNPIHIYSSDGIYSVQLITSNSYGSDTILKTSLITVTLGGYTCDTIRVPATGFGITQTNCNGYITDDGGSNANYSSNSNGIITIYPSDTSVAYLTLTFFSFNYENTWDYLYVYDGIDTNSTLIGKYTSTTLPNGGVIQSTGSAITLRQTSDGVTQNAGFLGEWKCYFKNQPPVADFSADLTKTCSGQIKFTDTSFPPATSWKWNFGDGKTDTVQNPNYTYSAPGIYSVTLIASNSNGPDTLIKTNYIVVTTPDSLPYYQDFEKGIDTNSVKVVTNLQSNVSVITDAANASTLGLMMGGNTSTAWTNPAAGEEFTINPDHFAKVSMCIDASKVSTLVLQFNLKLIYEYQNFYTNFRITANGSQVGSIFQPSGATSAWNAQLIDLSAYAGGVIELAFETNCKYSYDDGGVDIGNAVYIDNIKLTEMNLPPIADFSYDKNLTCDGTVKFTDISSLAPNSWSWNFDDGNTSSIKNPIHTFTKDGLYSVTLIATNTFGSDTVFKSKIISVKLGSFECDSFKMPVTGNSSSDKCKGMLSDDGGTSNNYSSNSDGTFTIAPAGCIANIKLTFTSIDFENNFDFLNIYDGPTTSSPLIGSYTSTTLPNGGIITSTSGSITLIQNSDGSVNKAGFFLTWQCSTITATVAPVASFAVADTFPCYGTATFEDLSTECPDKWLWDFGDGKTDSVSSPTHTYLSDGIYSIKLIVSNSFGSDTVIKANYISISLASTKCDTLKMLTSGDTTVTSCFGILTDNGGGGGDYTNNTNGVVTISPTGCVGNIALNFISFSVEDGFSPDFLHIYDGPDTNSTLIGSFMGDSLPNGGTIISSGSSITLKQQTDGFTTQAGYIVNWSCFIQTGAPVADFSVNTTVPCDGIVSFSDNSLNCPDSWLWDFGDGITDTVENPVHSYSVQNKYTVSLTVTNSYGTDSVTKINFINYDTIKPKSIVCKPQTKNTCCGVGIYNVNLTGVFDNTTPNASEGYQEFSDCSGRGMVTEGTLYPISIQTNPSASEHVRVWVDFDNNADFNDTTELVFSSDSVQFHTGTIFIPGTAVKDSLLRMRVSSEIGGLPAPGPCDSLELGQTEDYGLVVQKGTNPPLSDFSANDTLVCTGTVKFTDKSLYSPTSWLWNFGDGKTSTQQNPTHSFLADGLYTVTLKATNAFGNNSITKNNFINVTLSKYVIKPLCEPPTVSNCCSYGIYNVTFEGINYSSADGAEGYQDLACTQNTEVMEGQEYNISIQTGPKYNQDTRAWIDFDNNGVFDENSELVFSADNLKNPTGIVFIPGVAAKNTALRFRVSSDFSGSNPTSCSMMEFGQTEDYGITFIDNPNPPVARIDFEGNSSCEGVVQFIDKSLNVPTSWFWDFGDGFTDSLQHPLHTYIFNGKYTVTLIVTNAFGIDTIVKKDFIDVNCSYILGTATTSNDSVSYPAPYGNAKYGAKHQILVTVDDLKSIGIVDSGTINSIGFYVEKKKGTFLENFEIKIMNSSDTILTDFIDESGMTTIYGPTLFKDQNGWNVHTFSQKHIWNGKTNLLLQVCFNNEANSDNAIVQFTKSANNSVVYYAANDSLVCSKISGGSVSKNRPNLKFGYTGPPPTPNFTVNDTISCTGTFEFTDLTPDSKAWLWDFGDGKVSTEQHPIHSYSLAGTYSVSLQVANKYGNDTLTKVNYVNAATDQGPTIPSCRPNTLNYCCGYGINRFYLDGNDTLDINNYSSNASEGYMDFGCAHISEIYTDLDNEFILDVNDDSAYYQDIWVWIDLNNNGIFDDSERIFQKDSANVSLQGFLTIPSDTALILDKLLRLRILSDAAGALVDSCFEPQFGQVEDYGIIIRQVPAPVADFNIDTSFYNCGDSVIFSNLSKYDAARVWDFGDGNTSTEISPVHFYEEEGVFSVTLTATNSSGSDLLIKSNVVTVNCVFYLPDTGSLTVKSCNGKAFDNGGAGDYTDNTDVTFTIAPNDADHVILNFLSFDFETGADYLYVYDGADTSAILLGKFDGNSLPNGGTITSSSPYLTLRQVTDNFAVKPGFEADWTCQRIPTADFVIEYVDTCLQILKFYDLSNNSKQWLWLFGDGDSSTAQNSTHIFKSYNDYNVSLYVNNTYGSDTLIKTIPNFSVKGDFIMSHDTVDVAKSEQVLFTDKSSNATSWEWVLGDGNTSNIQNPVHQYFTIGVYNVYLIASNGICENTISKKLVAVDRTGMLDGLSESEFLTIYPNPSKDEFTLEYKFPENQNLKIEIKDALGRLIFEENKKSDHFYKRNFDFGKYNNGIYTLSITSDKKQIIRKIILQ